jgi:excinuclease ABC subunit A
VREEFERYQNNRACGTCGGYRLKPEALAVKIAGLHVGQVVQMSIREAYAWIDGVMATLTPQRTKSPAPSSRKSASGWGFL